jgi:hypothetical protein
MRRSASTRRWTAGLGPRLAQVHRLVTRQDPHATPSKPDAAPADRHPAPGTAYAVERVQGSPPIAADPCGPARVAPDATSESSARQP